jgi:hypothetical protein
MTRTELSDALDAIRWTPDILARALLCDVSLINAWLDGNAEIPMKAGIWIKLLADHHRAFEHERPKSLKGKRYRE